MTREEQMTAAEHLRGLGQTYEQIGPLVGVTGSCVRKWLNAEAAARYNATQNARRGPAKRAWAHEHDRGRCPCGNSLMVGSRRRGTRVCRECYAELQAIERAWRMQPIYELWHAGASLREIAATTGLSTPGAVSAHIAKMRREGWDMPYRHGSRETWERAVPGGAGRGVASRGMHPGTP